MTKDLSKSSANHDFSVGSGQAAITGSLTGVVPAHLLSEGEQIILAVKPSLWFVLFYSAPLIAIVMVLLIMLRFFPLINQSSEICRYAYQVAAVAVGLQLIVAILQWMGRLYVLTDRRVIRIKGIFNIDIFEAPLVKIQNTYMTFALHERLFALGTILIATAGTAGIEAAWQNIHQPLEVHELIRSAIQEARRRWPSDHL